MLRCEECSFLTIYKRSLDRHTRVIHQNPESSQPVNGNLSCPHCSYKTLNKSNFNRHVKNVHRSEVDAKPAVTNNNVYNSQTNYGTINNNNIQIYMPAFIQTEEQRQKLLDFVKKRCLYTPEDIVDAIKLFFDDVTRIPFRKTKSNTAFTHVYNGNSNWIMKSDDDVYPNVILKTSQDMACILNEEAEKDSTHDRERNHLANQSDRIGNFQDEVEDIQRNGICYTDTTKAIRSHRRAFRKAKNELKLKAKEAYQTYGLAVSENDLVPLTS